MSETAKNKKHPHSKFRRMKHNAEYLGLTLDEVAIHDAIMATPMNSWDKELKEFFKACGGAGCGDAIACLVASYLKGEKPKHGKFF